MTTSQPSVDTLTARHIRLLRAVLLVLFVVPITAGCSSEDGGNTAEGSTDANDADAADDSSDQESSDETGEGTDRAAPNHPSGTVTVDGETFEVSGREQFFEDGEMVDAGGDFAHCTYSDGGDEGHVTIQVMLSDTEIFYVSFGRADGISQSASYPDLPTSTGQVEARLESGRAIGSADFAPDGSMIEFDLDCDQPG